MSNGNCIKNYLKYYDNRTQSGFAGIVPRAANQFPCKINYCPALPVIFTCVYLPNTAYLSEIITRGLQCFLPHYLFLYNFYISSFILFFLLSPFLFIYYPPASYSPGHPPPKSYLIACLLPYQHACVPACPCLTALSASLASLWANTYTFGLAGPLSSDFLGTSHFRQISLSSMYLAQRLDQSASSG
jgi:hypothetical protein